MKLDTDSPNVPQQRRAQPGRGRAIVLAVLVHLAFLALIVFGVSWQSSPVAPLQAELWDKLPSAVKPVPTPAPKAQTPPKPQSQFGPLPPAQVTPVPIKPPEVKPAPPKPDPEIAEKAERLKREQAEAAKHKQLQEEAAKKKAQEEAAQKKAQEEAAKKKAQEEAAKKKQQEEAQRKKLEEEQRKQAQQRAAAQAQAEAERARAAAATARQRAVDEWVDRIRRKILSRANVPDTVPTGAELNVRIRILPGGDVLDFTVTSSTNPTYRAAIERAIRSASPLPVPDPNSELFSQFRDLNVNFKHER